MDATFTMQQILENEENLHFCTLFLWTLSIVPVFLIKIGPVMEISSVYGTHQIGSPPLLLFFLIT
jgi:hypothetical protein